MLKLFSCSLRFEITLRRERGQRNPQEGKGKKETVLSVPFPVTRYLTFVEMTEPFLVESTASARSRIHTSTLKRERSINASANWI
jgi:hypothetical protein